VAVLSLGGTVYCRSVRVGGDKMDEGLKEDDMYVIFSKQRVSPAFVDAFSNALHQFKQTAAFGAIYRKYFPATPYEPAQ
jgi:polar amino acid transport system substrate-binding protein